jgi:hypothetical protein
VTARVPLHVPDALGLRGEIELYGGLTIEERARLLAAACRAGARMLRSRPDAERVAEFLDPLPESSVRALARLRREAAARRRPVDLPSRAGPG